MLIKAEIPFDLGDKFYVIVPKSETVYRPCKVCKNSRTVTYVSDDGDQYLINCPRCTGHALKGDPKKSILHYTFKIVPYFLTSVEFLCARKEEPFLHFTSNEKVMMPNIAYHMEHVDTKHTVEKLSEMRYHDFYSTVYSSLELCEQHMKFLRNLHNGNKRDFLAEDF